MRGPFFCFNLSPFSLWQWNKKKWTTGTKWLAFSFFEEQDSSCIIIKLWWKHRSPWFSLSLSLSLYLAICPYRPSLLRSSLDNIQCPHRVDECKFLLVGKLCSICVGVHWRTSLMSSSLLLQQCSVCLTHLSWMTSEMGGKLLFSWCFVGCCFQDLFKNSM